jgi:hypothetical protein
MAVVDLVARDETIAKMAQTRAEIRRILEPAPRGPQGGDESREMGGADGPPGTFPRSRTMRMLMSGRGMGTAGAVIGGLVLARPALAFKLLRMLPMGAVARMLLVKGITALRSRH